MEIILLIYGFSFLALSAVVAVCVKKENRLDLTSSFAWLGAFAFVHGTLEWMELWRSVRGDDPVFAAIRGLVLLASYLLLFEFGHRMARAFRQPGPSIGIVIGLADARIHILLLGGVLAAAAASPGEFIPNMVVWTRYLVGTSASLLVGIGFIERSRKEFHPGALNHSFPTISGVCRLAGIAFLLYGIFGGLVVPRMDWAPAAWLNQDSFVAAVHAPVELFRAASATLIAFSLGAIVFWNANLKEKIWLLTSAVVALILAVDMIVGYDAIESTIRTELTRDAKDVRAMLMATRRVYHQQFIASELPVNEKTIGFLPAQALSRISKDFPNWSQSGLSFNNVSDQPRNPANRADGFELQAMEFFRANPKADERLVEIRDISGRTFYHYTAPIWIEPYCLKCHGTRESAPASIARNYDTAYGYRLGDLRGVMSIKLPVTPLRNSAYREWFLQFSLRFVGYTLLALMLIMFLNRVVVGRLQKLRQTTAQLAAGDYSVRSAIGGSDEVSELSLAFNAMGEQIQARDKQIRNLSSDRLKAIEELQIHKNNLESVVSERTADLNDQAKRLELANGDLESFAYSVSHDLRTPLRAIDGWARILREDEEANLSPEGKAILERIWVNSDKMGVLIDDILQFTRVGRTEMARLPTDMTGLARDVTEELRGDYPATRISISEMPEVTGDRAMLRQVWSNLIGNALKFSAKQQQPEVEIGSELQNGETVFFVRDNGVGFDMAHTEKLFLVFHRLHSISEFPGTGAGLSIVKRIIERHGGCIWVDAQIGKGATFRFTLTG
ncbi:MAG: DUF3365 domain-containing protein [Rhodocyclaceae bacterium]|nr:DUF3365 domain-containing protein [Rhodocyclaceae bacterium]